MNILIFPRQKKNAKSAEDLAFFDSMFPLSFGKLRFLPGFPQTNLLTLYFTGIASHESRFAKRRPQVVVVFHQSPGDAMANSTGLAKTTAAAHRDVDVETLCHFQQFERLPHYHSGDFSTEISIQWPSINRDVTATTCQKDAGSRGLATTCAVILSTCHRCFG
jgi:hypothetical protein